MRISNICSSYLDKASRSLAATALLLPMVASAQAWLPDKGTLNTSFVVSDVLNREHYLPNGDTIDVGHTRSTTYAMYASYGLTDRWMISGTLPYVTTRYWGPPSHGGAPGLTADNGDEHGSLTDLRLNVHYQLLEEPFAFAPFVGYVLPVADYYVKGHAAQGRHLNELLFGFNAGKNLNEWIPRTYVQARYTYALVDKVADIKHDRTNVNLELGTFVTPRWSLSAYGSWQWTHGGIDVPIPRSNPLFPYHDRLAADEFFNLGFGTGWSLTPSMTAYAIYTQGIHGSNGHKVNQGVAVGVSYGYRPRAEAVGVASR